MSNDAAGTGTRIQFNIVAYTQTESTTQPFAPPTVLYPCCTLLSVERVSMILLHEMSNLIHSFGITEEVWWTRAIETNAKTEMVGIRWGRTFAMGWTMNVSKTENSFCCSFHPFCVCLCMFWAPVRVRDVWKLSNWHKYRNEVSNTICCDRIRKKIRSSVDGFR